MPSRCVVAGCSNTNKDDVSLHYFPKDEHFRRIWTSKVKLTRANWGGPGPVESRSSVICSAHFPDDAFEVGLHSMFNMKRTRRLKPDAIPVIKLPSSTEESKGKEKKRPVRTAAEKRKKMRVVDELLALPSNETLQKPKDQAQAIEEAEKTSYSTPSGSVPVVPTPEDPHEFAVEEADDEPGCSSWSSPLHGQMETQIAPDISQQGSKSDVAVKTTQTTGTQVSVTTRVKKVQVQVQTREMGCQVCLPPTTTTTGTSYDPPTDTEEDLEEEKVEDIFQSSPLEPAKPSSPEYIPPSSSSSSELSSPEKPRRRVKVKRKSGPTPGSTWEPIDYQPHEEPKYIVFESCLMQLLKQCPACGSGNISIIKKERGSMLSITRECWTCQSKAPRWDSQTLFGSTPAGNMLLSAAILFAGGSCSTTLRILRNLRVASIAERTFYQHQKQVLVPTVSREWQLHQDSIITHLRERGLPLTIGGDGRADSPGHSAKYGTYTALELETNKIVDLQLVQSNEVAGSYHMELEGFKRCMSFLNDKGLSVDKLVTDRHRQLAKHVRETMQETSHTYDVWHVAKGVRKKVHALAKQKDCDVLLEWEQSICNHIYWIASSTPEDEEELKVAKWKSLHNHIQGTHRGHSEVFPTCLHDDLDGHESNKKWLKPGTKVCEKLGDIISSTYLLKDMKKLSGGKQTSSLESFHGVINHFAPKMKAYGYKGMTTRLQLAVLHYNTNSERPQATTKAGQKRFKVVKPKYKPGRASVKAVKEDASFSYVDDLMVEVSRRAPNYTTQEPEGKADPPHLSSKYTYPSKEELVKHHTSRFSLDP